jgi:hypothetical protein
VSQDVRVRVPPSVRTRNAKSIAGFFIFLDFFVKTNFNHTFWFDSRHDLSILSNFIWNLTKLYLSFPRNETSSCISDSSLDGATL